MKLIRYAYAAPTDLEQVFGALFPSSARCGNTFANDSWAGSPATDVFEDANNYYVRTELAGARREDINVALEDAELTVTAARGEGDARTEYRRSLAVPENIDPAKVSAAYENGVLTVTLPKQESRKSRSINVQ